MTSSDLGDFVTITVQRAGKKLTCSLPSEGYEAQAAEVRELLSEENIGYLSPLELRECLGLLARTDYLEITNPQRARRRIAQLKEAGVPPLYENTGSVVPTSCFPIVDFMIQFPTGRLLKSWAGQHAKNKRNPKKSFVLRTYPSSLDDILEFRTLAFDGDHLSPQVIREFGDYSSEKETGEVDNKIVLQADILRLKYLELLLVGIRPRERSYQPRREGDFSFIGHRFWHTDYTPEDRERIARDYVQRLTERGIEFEYLRKHKRMQALFPDIVVDKEGLARARNERDMEECQRSGDYRLMPQIVLMDGSYDSKYLEELRGHLQRSLGQLIRENVLRVYDRLQDLHSPLKVPYGLLYLTEFRDIITAERLRILNTIDDSTFVELFGNRGRFMSIGHRQEGSWKESLVDEQFRDELIRRRRSLVS